MTRIAKSRPENRSLAPEVESNHHWPPPASTLKSESESEASSSKLVMLNRIKGGNHHHQDAPISSPEARSARRRHLWPSITLLSSVVVCFLLQLGQLTSSQSPQAQQLQMNQLNVNNQSKTTQIATERPPNYIETGRQITGILDRFMSLGYDKRVRPNYGGPPVEVNVTMRILSISSVSEVMMDFTADFYFRQTWHDPRLSFKKLGDIQTLYVGAEVSKKIWLPDTFFGNEKLAYFHEATTPNVFLRIDHSGEVYRSIRLTVTSSCPMNLQYFPMDRQRCTIEAESYGYNVKDIIYRWARDTAVERDDKISLPQFDIVNTVQKYRLEVLSSGTYSRLICEIHFARRMGYYLIQIYIPSSLIVVISWVSFWLHRNASPARVQLGVTTVLTMTTLMSSTNAALPKISYVKSIDIFLGTCFIMVFAALLEYATVGYLGKRIAMRKAHLQHAHSQAQARLFAQLQAQGAQGEPMPPMPGSGPMPPPPDQLNPLGSPLGAAAGFVTGQTGVQTNWMDELTAMAAAANASEPALVPPPPPPLLDHHELLRVGSLASGGAQPPQRRPPQTNNNQDATSQSQLNASGRAATAAAAAAPQVPVRHHCSSHHLCHRNNGTDERGATLFTCHDNYNDHNHHQSASKCCQAPLPPPPPDNHHNHHHHHQPQCRTNCCSFPQQAGSCRLATTRPSCRVACDCDHQHHHHACSGRSATSNTINFGGPTSQTLPRNLTFAMEDFQNNHHLHHPTHETNSNHQDKLQRAMQLGLDVSPNSNLSLHQDHHNNNNNNNINDHSASLPPSYLGSGGGSSKGASAAAAAAAATFINMHRKNKGLPPSTNPNFAQFSWAGQQQNRSLETILGIRPSDIDKYSRVVFPVCFVCFQLMYWIVYLHISAFLETEQQQQSHS